jgi:hypothetical protein
MVLELYLFKELIKKKLLKSLEMLIIDIINTYIPDCNIDHDISISKE